MVTLRRKARRVEMSSDTRLKLGVALLILGMIMPVGTLLVAATDWPIAVKTVVSGILLFGFEIILVPAVALMGKNNFERIWAGAMRLLKTLKPVGHVGRPRYTVGLYMLAGPPLVCLDRELRSLVAAGELRPAGWGQSGSRPRYPRQLVCAGRRFLGQGAGAVCSRRPRPLPILSDHDLATRSLDQNWADGTRRLIIAGL